MLAARARERAWFTAALISIGLANAVVRMPSDHGHAHWSEWFVFYFSPPILEGLIFGAICWAVIRPKPGESKWAVRLPLRGITIAVVASTLMAYAGRA